MLKKRNAQGMSIKIIIVAIIGLIILAAVVMMLSGNLGAFGGGIEAVGDPLKTCADQPVGANLKKPGVDCAPGEVQIASSDSLRVGRKCCKNK